MEDKKEPAKTEETVAPNEPAVPTEENCDEPELIQVEVYNPMMCRHEKRWVKKEK
jgi:hypothetical protein